MQRGKQCRNLAESGEKAKVNIHESKLSPANLLELFSVSVVFVPQLSIMYIVDFNKIYSAWLP